MNQNSDHLSPSDIAIVKLLLTQGFHQKRIASLFDVNQGRIAEINSGRKHKCIYIPNLTRVQRQCHTYPLKTRGQDRK